MIFAMELRVTDTQQLTITIWCNGIPEWKVKCFQWLGSKGHSTVYSKNYAHDFCFAVLCCGYTLTDFPISIRLTSLALWQSNDCPSASKATLMNMDKYFMWNQYERLHNRNKAKHNKTVCIFLGIYCMFLTRPAVNMTLNIIDIYRVRYTVKPVYNDHLMEYFSAFWSSSRWPMAT